MDKTLLLDVENSMLKSALTILRRNSLDVKSSSPILLCHTRKLLLLPQTLFAWPSHPTSTTDFMLKLPPYTTIYQGLLRKVKLPQKTILNWELSFWMKNLIGIRKMHWKFGVLDQKTLEETYWWTRHQEFNIWMNWENQWNQLGNGQLRNPYYVKKTWEVLELIL